MSKNDIKQRDLEQIRLELNCRLEEYRALRLEIVSTLTSAYQTTNLTLITIGAVVSGYRFTEVTPLLLNAATLIFYMLVFTQLRYECVVFNMSDHIINRVTPAIRVLLNNTSPSDNKDGFSTVLSWELSGREDNHPSSIGLLPIELARYGLPLFFAVATFITFLWLNNSNNYLTCLESAVLIVVNFALFVYSIWALFYVREKLQGKTTPFPLEKYGLFLILTKLFILPLYLCSYSGKGVVPENK
jgi:hypothetical protein